MSEYDEETSAEWEAEAAEADDAAAHSEVSSEATGGDSSGDLDASSPESGEDLEEDGYDSGSHGGGQLEDVADFESEYAMTEGFSVLGEQEADDLSGIDACCGDDFETPESVCGRDDRRRITSTSRVPWRMICKLVITRRDGRRSGCTGWFIGPRTVMTAGHCVYSHSAGGWARKIEVIPGMNARTKPFGSMVGTSFRSVTGWTKDKKVTHDYGCIILPSDTLGKRVGWFGFANLSTSSLKNLLINNAGYPGDKPFGTLWYNAGRITKVTSRRLYYMMDTAGGQSGSPTWRYRNGKRHAIGVHAYGGCPNKSTRINKAVFNNMKKWKNV